MALILYVTADLSSLAQVSPLLAARGHRVVHVADATPPIPLDPSPDLVLIDTSLGAGDAALVTSSLIASVSRPPILVLADRDRAESAVAAMKGGAEDIMFKPIDPLGLPMRVDGLLATAALDRSSERLKTDRKSVV